MVMLEVLLHTPVHKINMQVAVVAVPEPLVLMALVMRTPHTKLVTVELD